MVAAARGEVEPGAPGVAVAGDREVREQAGLQPVADGVEDADVRDVPVERVVEGVAADVVRGREQAADDDALGAEGEGRQQAVLHLGGQRHRLPAAHPLVVVGVGAVADEQLGEQVRELGQRGPLLVGQRRGAVVEDDLEHAQALQAVEQRHPQAVPGVAVGLEGLDRPEAASGERAVDRQPLGEDAGRAAEPAEGALVVVDEPQDGRRGAEVLRAQDGERVDLVRGHQVGAAQDGVERGGVRAGQVSVHPAIVPRRPLGVCPAVGRAPQEP